MKRVYKFLEKLRDNNNREWFEANKSEYKEVQALFNTFTQELINEISLWDSEINADILSVKDCTYRIYRDIRFSKNKLPYKTHIGAFICKGGKKSPYPGYYFHIEPNGEAKFDLFGGNFLYAGLHCPEPKVVHSVRDEIYVNGGTIIDALNSANGFNTVCMSTLKRVPKGFEDVNPAWADLIKQKDFSLGQRVDLEYISAPNLAKRVSNEFKKCYEFTSLMYKAVDYALEEM